MKIKIDIKDPDGFYESIRSEAIDIVRKQCPELYEQSFEDKAAKKSFNMLVQEKQEEIEESLKKWVNFGECCTLEFDTEADTAIVKKKNSSY